MVDDQTIRKEAFAYFDGEAPVLFFAVSTDGRIIKANRYAKTITGRVLVDENIRDLILDLTATFDLTALSTNPLEEHLLHIGTASGLPQSFYFLFKQVPGCILVFGRLDALELETLRKEVLSLNQELNNLMRELHKKNAQLKRLNEEKNRFLGMAAHDLRKPIGLVITYSEFLIEEAVKVLDDEQLHFLNTINASSTFMKRLVDDFLDVSAIEAGRFEFDLQPASIRDVLEQSLMLNTFQARKKGIELKVRCDHNIPRLLLDASKMEQVITNLVSNAIEHSDPDTEVIIRIYCDLHAVFFTVRDKGPGIAPDEIDKLFKAFEKTRSKKTAGEKSTGLGMLISRIIIEGHGGEIWVESSVGKGTCIHFKLPLDGEDRHEPGYKNNGSG